MNSVFLKWNGAFTIRMKTNKNRFLCFGQNGSGRVFPLCLMTAALFCCLLASDASGTVPDERDEAPITLRTMGSLFFGGTVTALPDGETFHGDHGYAQFYIPQHARTYPLVLWHGIGQSGRSYETTPDGREGFMSIFPRRDWPVYIIDQPRRGRAGRTSSAGQTRAVPTVTRESSAWNAFRNGLWIPPFPPSFHPGSQFPRDPAAVEQFFRQQTPDTGEEPRTPEYYAWMGKTMARLFERTGPCVLVTHSYSGRYGWHTVMAAPESVKAVIAFEPGHCVFPEDERLEEIDYGTEEVAKTQIPVKVSSEEFEKLTRIPILIIFGDFIASEPSPVFNVNVWRVARMRAEQFARFINKRGGDARVIRLPELGIKGNTHAPFADLNNKEIASLMEAWLREKGLDGREHSYKGPRPQQAGSYTIPLKTQE